MLRRLIAFLTRRWRRNIADDIVAAGRETRYRRKHYARQCNAWPEGAGHSDALQAALAKGEDLHDIEAVWWSL